MKGSVLRHQSFYLLVLLLKVEQRGQGWGSVKDTSYTLDRGWHLSVHMLDTLAARSQANVLTLRGRLSHTCTYYVS